MTQFKNLLLILFLSIQVLGAGSYFKGPGLIEGFTTITSAAGTTTLTVASETKQIVTGSTTQTIKLPDATTLPLGRKFLIINKSSGTVTVNDNSSSLVATVLANTQVEVHLRVNGTAAGTWDALASSAASAWGSITGTLSSQTDLQSALNLKAPLASPTFTGTIGTPLTASKLLATDASGNLTATAANSSQASYLDLTSSAQTQLNGKLSTSNYSAKGDLVAGVSSGVVAGVTVGSNGKVLVADSGATAGLRWDNATPKKNYVTNWNAEGGVTTGWSTYADAAGTKPVDCTGGTPNSTWAASSSSAIHDSNNFLATLNTGATRQGEGVSYAFTVDSGDAPAMMSIKFFYKVAGGTFAAGNDADRTSAGDSDFTVWIYDVTNGTLIQPFTYRLYSNSTTVAEPFVSNFQTNSNSTSYRLCIHKGTPTSVSGTAITVRFDDFEISRSNIALNTPISDWTSWTPTGSWVSNSTYTGLKRRVGSDNEYKVNIALTGAPTSANLTVNLPSGETIDTTKLVNSTPNADLTLGSGTAVDNGSAEYQLAIGYNSTTSVQLRALDTATSYLKDVGPVTATVPATWGNTDWVVMQFKVPIAGQSSNSQVSDGWDARQVATLVNRVTSSQTISGASDVKIQWNNKVSDLTASFDSTTNYRFTVPSSGVYRFSGNIAISAAASSVNVYAYLYKNGSPVRTLGTAISSTTLTYSIPLNGQDTAVAGDYYEVFVNPASVSMNVLSSATINGGSHLSIEKLSSPQTMSATEVVSAFYTVDGSGQSMTSTAVIQYNSKVHDTHSAVTTGASWKFTAPIAGFYSVFARAFSANNTSGSPQMSFRKNGVVLLRSQPTAIFSGGASIASNQMVQDVNTTIWLNAGDYIDYYINSAATAGTIYTATTDSWIKIDKIK